MENSIWDVEKYHPNRFFDEQFFFNHDHSQLVLETKKMDEYSLRVYDFEENEEVFSMSFDHPYIIFCVDVCDCQVLIVDIENPHVLQIYEYVFDRFLKIKEIQKKEPVKADCSFKRVIKAQFLNENCVVCLYEGGNICIIQIPEDENSTSEEEELEGEGETDDEAKEKQSAEVIIRDIEDILSEKHQVKDFCVSSKENRLLFTSTSSGKNRLNLIDWDEDEDKLLKKVSVEVDNNIPLKKVFISSGQGNRIVACSEDGIYYLLFDKHLEKMTTLYRGKKSAVIKSLSFSEDGAYLAVLTDRMTVHIFSTKTKDNPKPYLHGITKGFTYDKSFSKFHIRKVKEHNELVSQTTKNPNKVYKLLRFTKENNVFIIGENQTSLCLSFDTSKPGECNVVDGRTFSGFSDTYGNLKFEFRKIFSFHQRKLEKCVHGNYRYFFQLYSGSGLLKSKSHLGRDLLDDNFLSTFYFNVSTESAEGLELLLQIIREKTLTKEEKCKAVLLFKLPRVIMEGFQYVFGREMEWIGEEFGVEKTMFKSLSEGLEYSGPDLFVYAVFSVTAVDFGREKVVERWYPLYKLFSEEYKALQGVTLIVLSFLSEEDITIMGVLSRYLYKVVKKLLNKDVK